MHIFKFLDHKLNFVLGIKNQPIVINLVCSINQVGMA